MLVAVTAGASHPAVAVLLGLAAASVAGGVVAMAWSVHARQLRLAAHLAQRRLIVTGAAGQANPGAAAGQATPSAAAGQATLGAAAAAGQAAPGPAGAAPWQATSAAAAPATASTPKNGKAAPAAPAPPAVIAGPDTILAGEPARYRVLAAGPHTVVSWAAGGGPVSHRPDPDCPGDLLLIADEPASLTVIARVREGMAERRATKPVTAVADPAAPAPSFPLRFFLHGWGLAAAAILITGFAAALAALGSLAPSGFIALAVSLAALLTVTTVTAALPRADGGQQPGGTGQFTRTARKIRHEPREHASLR